ncbi:DMT family protein [Citromicrobium bathyomarinum]
MSPKLALLAPIALLALSNIVMNVAWYANLKAPEKTLVWAIGVSWLIALGEYVFAVPANRIGIAAYSLAELKTITTIFSLVGVVIVAFFMFGEKPGLNQLIGFALIGAGSFFIFKP